MLARFILSALAVGLTGWLLPGVELQPWWAAALVALVLGLINTFITPLVKLFALPVTILTLGLFTLVINALMVLLCAWFVPDHFKVDGFWWALLFSIVLSVVSGLLNSIFDK